MPSLKNNHLSSLTIPYCESEVKLRRMAGHLVGDASGRIQAIVDVYQTPGLLPHAQLVKEIGEADRKLFEAYDGCNVEAYASYLSPDLEFYHDRGGKRGIRSNSIRFGNDAERVSHCAGNSSRIQLLLTMLQDLGPSKHRFYAKQKDGSERLDAMTRFAEIWGKRRSSLQNLCF